VIQIAREDSFSGLERIATFNLAEDRLWQGAVEEAARLAQRSLSLQRDHGEGVVTQDLLLIARIQAVSGEDALSQTVTALAEATDLTVQERDLLSVLRCAADHASADVWAEVLDAAWHSLDGDVRIEAGFLAARHGALSASRREEVRAEATRHPIWSRRAGEL
jgi:hypothetical protein